MAGLSPEIARVAGDTPAQLVFIIGTGRCGTDSYAQLLSGVAGCYVVHEFKPVLLKETTDYLQGSMTESEMVRLLAETRGTLAQRSERIVGESNQRLTFLLRPLSLAFPLAKYIVVVRDARRAIPSMLHRYWYHPSEAKLRPDDLLPWAQHRIRADMVGQMSAEDWRQLSSFERCAWYWSYTYERAECNIAELALDALVLRLESGQDGLPLLWKFLGLDSASTSGVALPRSNRASQGAPPSWKGWTSRERMAFERFCSPLMDKYYPEWRAEWQVSRRERLHHQRKRFVSSSVRVIKRYTYNWRLHLGLAEWSRR